MPVPKKPTTPYWRKNVQILTVLLSIWFQASYVMGILLVEPLNEYHLGGFPLGFWFAQQGSIYVFVVLILIYAVWLSRLDRQYATGAEKAGGQGEDEPGAGGPS